MIDDFVKALTATINKGLPGEKAHKLMAPVARQTGPFNETDYPQANRGSVMILFYELNEAIHFVLIKRPSYDGVHGGQISFPGGRFDIADKNSADTALRECEEETGIGRNEITIFGRLSNIYIPPSDYFVFPYMGYLNSPPVFHPDIYEVEEIIEVPVQLLLDEKIKGMIDINTKERSFSAPCYLIKDHKVWGATAIILSELEWLLKLGEIEMK